MIESKILLCADGIVRDAESNNISIFNIIEELSSRGFPTFRPNFSCFSSLERATEDSQEYDLQLKVFNNSVELATINAHVNFQDKMRNRLIIGIQGLVIPDPGILKIILYDGERALNSYAITVKHIGQPELRLEV